MKNCLFLILLLLMIVPSTASAESIWKHQSVTVPAGQTVSDVYVIGGDATILGAVTGTVVVMNGDVMIKRSAHIHGLVIVVGGKVLQESGAKIGDDVYAISFDDTTKNSLLIGGGMVLGIWALQLAGSLLLILIPVLISLLGRKRLVPAVEQYRYLSLGKLLYSGFLSGLLLSGISMLLIISLIGIPIMLLMLLFIVIAFFAGLTAFGYWIGERVQGTIDRAVWLKVLIGTSIITAFTNIPIIGGFVLLFAILATLGITTMWLSEKLKRRNKRKMN